MLTAVALCAAMLAALDAVLSLLLGSTLQFAFTAMASFAGGALGIAMLARRALGPRAFGAANLVTLMRVALLALLVALFAETARAPMLWLGVVVTIIALILDGVDGTVARRRNEVSDFGGRFDMETDAAYILVLAGLAWHFDRVGAWVLLAGLLRYLFVSASLVFAWLRTPLPRSRRRQTICVVQIVSLILCLAPIVPASLCTSVAAAGLAALAASFTLDVIWLARACPKRLGRQTV